jgi:uncharacterized membrane protein YsdA (DUF1294 family)
MVDIILNFFNDYLKNYFIIYLIVINICSGIFFFYDKIISIFFTRKSKYLKRIPEYIIHILELLGGIFIIILLMYLIRHKNKKVKYYFVTYAIFILWLFLLIIFITMHWTS